MDWRGVYFSCSFACVTEREGRSKQRHEEHSMRLAGDCERVVVIVWLFLISLIWESVSPSALRMG